MIRPKLAPQQQRAPGSGTFPRTLIRPKVVTCPDPRLSQPCHEVDPRDPAVVAVARLMVTTMYGLRASVGLAAPQLGESMRLVCLDVTDHEDASSCAGLVVLANPRIVHREGNIVLIESCKSVPHSTGRVARAELVVVEGVLPGTDHQVRLTADGIEARTLLHEIDHLDGYLFVDRMLDVSR